MGTKRMAKVALCVALGLAAQGVYAEQQVVQFSGDASGNTAEFSVEAPWILDWLVSGDPGQYEVVDVALVNAATGAYEGAAVRSNSAGNGVRLFDKGGRYYFRVNSSMMNWKLKVFQLTQKEAEQYKPKTPESMLDR
jgi:hypothetical protein